MEIPCELQRRDFVKQLAGAAGLAAAVGAESVQAQTRERPPGTIPTCTLGKTGLHLPVLGLGGGALPKSQENPSSEAYRVELVREAYDRGVRYFDTSRGYFESEAILGEALKDRRRHICLVTKIDTTKPEEVRESAELSLKALQTDHLDVLLIHGTPALEGMSVAQAMKTYAAMCKLRDERVTRFLGFSAHGYFDKALAMIDSGGFDLCMLSYGYLPRGWDQVWTARMTALRNACVARAHTLGMGIVAMKVLGNGMLGAWSGSLVPGFDPQRLSQLPGAAIRYVLQDPRIHVLNIGMRLKEDLAANLRILSGDLTYTPDDRDLLAEYSARLFDTEAIRKMRIEG